MSTLAAQQRDLPKVQAALAEHAGAGEAQVSGPITVLSATAGKDGARSYQVSTSVLLPVDENDPALRNVSIPVPVTANVDLDRGGAVVNVAVPPVDPASAREARAYARNLIQTGAVKGLPPTGRVRRSAGPPTRPTHELKTEANGRKVIRRTGFLITG